MDLTAATTKELADELERREDQTKPEWAPGAVRVHGFSCGEEGVIVKYTPYGYQGGDKKGETVQYGIYNARIIVVRDDA